MSYKRTIIPESFATGDALTQDLAGIGMNFATSASPNPNIENTLVAASIEALERDDLRVASVLTTWFGIHSPMVNADRLYRAVQALSYLRVKAYWAATGNWRSHDRRFARFQNLYQDKPVKLLRAGNDFQLQRRGIDARFENSALAVPAGTLRDRPADVLPPEILAQSHGTYRCRVQMGPSYRADMWAELEQAPALSPAELARKTYGSFGTAWQVKQDWNMLQAA